MDVERWVVLYIAVLTGKPSDIIDQNVLFSSLDFDSVDSVEMSLEFEKKYGTAVDPALFLNEEITIRELIGKLDAAFQDKTSR